ncbi:MAG: hypothetical protein Q7T79_03035 [bacterium]|nr:hypothetical protein [bacterium]
MKFFIKKYIYLLNDFTNLLLNKDRATDKEKIKKLRSMLIIVSIILVVFIILNCILLSFGFSR